MYQWVKRVNPEVHKIYIKRVGFSLIRVHRQQLHNANTSTAELMLQQLKWPIEYLFIGMKVKNYHASSDAGDKRQALDRWFLFCAVTDTTYSTQGQNVFQEADWLDAGGTVAIADTGVATIAVAGSVTVLNQYDNLMVNGAIYALSTASVPAGSAVAAINALTPTLFPAPNAAVAASTVVKKLTRVGLQVVTQKCARTINNLTLKAHGINLYDNFPSGFFNAYTSQHYGGVNINTPEDVGALFVPFCLYPGTYQPSGHINVSRAREFYLTYDSSIINGSVEGTLVVIGSAINFLLISDGSAVLRYST